MTNVSKQHDNNYWLNTVEYFSLIKQKGSQPKSCHNGCCQSQPCLNGGICSEMCDVRGKRSQCACVPGFTGFRCEIGGLEFSWLFLLVKGRRHFQRRQWTLKRRTIVRNYLLWVIYPRPSLAGGKVKTMCQRGRNLRRNVAKKEKTEPGMDDIKTFITT